MEGMPRWADECPKSMDMRLNGKCSSVANLIRLELRDGIPVAGHRRVGRLLNDWLRSITVAAVCSMLADECSLQQMDMRLIAIAVVCFLDAGSTQLMNVLALRLE
nr:hypothetical protein Iba_chr15dCG3820 [Ipomoea batatas]